jgi:tocopherol O-methyltransferase
MEDPSATTHDTNGDFVANYPVPSPSAFTSFDSLKGRIREHYEVCSDYYYSLWQAT